MHSSVFSLQCYLRYLHKHAQQVDINRCQKLLIFTPRMKFSQKREIYKTGHFIVLYSRGEIRFSLGGQSQKAGQGMDNVFKTDISFFRRLVFWQVPFHRQLSYQAKPGLKTWSWMKYLHLCPFHVQSAPPTYHHWLLVVLDLGFITATQRSQTGHSLMTVSAGHQNYVIHSRFWTCTRE